MLDFADRPQLRLLLDHFGFVEDDREPWRVAHPLPEVLLLAVCGTIGACDDFDEIVEWGEDNLDFLRRFLPYRHGLPGARWLRILMNRIGPELFSSCFRSWACALRPEAPELVAIDGKTSRGSHDGGRGRAALHLVSAFATRERLVLGQEAVGEGSCEQDTIPLLLEKLAASGSLAGAIVTIDAIACNAKVAQAVLDAGADYLLAVKANQPGLLGEIERFFAYAPPQSLAGQTDVDKGHGRVEERIVRVSADIDWLDGDRRFPGEYRFPKIAAIASVEARVHEKGADRIQRRFYIASRKMTAAELGRAVRGHWAIENSLHWVLDVVFPAKIRPDREPDTVPPTWPSSAASPSTSYAPQATSEASSSDEKRPDETTNTSPKSLIRHPVNPDSGPWNFSTPMGWTPLRRHQCAKVVVLRTTTTGEASMENVSPHYASR